jgi:hypothetical protein
MYVPFICKNCGKQRDRHSNDVSRARHSDFSPLDGYERSFVDCPGFEQKADQRNLRSGEDFDGLERRLKPPPITVTFDERKGPRTGERSRMKTFSGDDRRKK